MKTNFEQLRDETRERRSGDEKGRTGRRIRNGYEKGIRFVSRKRMIKWLMQIKSIDMV